MKIAGIIAEYNPFHSGHAHHIRETRARSGCDYVVACMAGSYTQRGEAACIDKWSRARAALRCGADAVFELPALWAVRAADAFARGGVAILSGLGCDCLSFGCESADPALLRALAQLREDEPADVSAGVQRRLEAGQSHARARGEALAEHLSLPPEALNVPNLILGAEYVRAIDALGARMEVVAVPRAGGYHDLSLGTFASASAIRAALASGRGADALSCVPPEARESLERAPEMHAPDDLLLHALRRMTQAQLAALPDGGEGLEARVARCARQAASREELIDMVKCKRYTRARIARLCAHALLEVDRDLCARHPLPEYARLIGMRADARPLLAELKRRSRLPIASRAAELAGNEIFQLECRATDLRALQCDATDLRRAGQEFTQKFVRV